MNQFVVVSCLTALLWCVHTFAQEGADPVSPQTANGDSVAETLILLQHQLRDVVTKRDLGAKYAACNRASEVYQGVAVELTPEQRVTWRKRIGLAFKRLPLPEVVIGKTSLHFHRVGVANGFVYVSEAVTAGQYAAFLTDRGITVDRIRDQFYEIPFLQAAEMVTASDRTAPVSGLSYRAADAFREWVSGKEGAKIHLPRMRELPAGLRRTLWVSDPWQEPDAERAELYRLYGGNPVTLLDSGKPVAEFAEAISPGVQLHLSMSADDARRFQLRVAANVEVEK